MTTRFNDLNLGTGLLFKAVKPQISDTSPAEWILPVGPAILNPRISVSVVPQRGGAYGSTKQLKFRMVAVTPVDPDSTTVSYANSAEIKIVINDKTSGASRAELKAVFAAYVASDEFSDLIDTMLPVI